MKKARFALLTIAILSIAGSAMAYKAQNKSILRYFITDIFDDIATQTFTHATITILGGTPKYYTFVDAQRARFWGRIIKLAL